MSATVHAGQQPHVQLHSRLDPPEAIQPFTSPRWLKIYHPAYPHAAPLFEIPAFDSDGDILGIHCGSVLVMCGIIAGNRWDGWLQERNSNVKIDKQMDDVLRATSYEFHLPYPNQMMSHSSSYKYAIVPAFGQWPFPHENTPPGWDFGEENNCFGSNRNMLGTARSNISQAVCARDQFRCQVTKDQDVTECAHLIPRKENQWFIDQDMSRYGVMGSTLTTAFVEEAANALTLRQDIHTMFDRRCFVFLPKRGSFVPHFLQITAQVGQKHHNRPVDLPGVHPAYCLARLAWTLFPRLHVFLMQSQARLLRLKKDDSATWEDVDLAYPELLRRIPELPSRLRSESPKKRPRGTGDRDESEDGRRNAKRQQTRHTAPSVRSTQRESAASSTTLVTTMTAKDVTLEKNFWTAASSQQGLDEDALGQKRLQSLRREALLGQRRDNSHLRCCDYDANEEHYRSGDLEASGLEWPSLCSECRGIDFVDVGDDQE